MLYLPSPPPSTSACPPQTRPSPPLPLHLGHLLLSGSGPLTSLKSLLCKLERKKTNAYPKSNCEHIFFPLKCDLWTLQRKFTYCHLSHKQIKCSWSSFSKIVISNIFYIKINCFHIEFVVKMEPRFEKKNVAVTWISLGLYYYIFCMLINIFSCQMLSAINNAITHQELKEKAW